MNASILFFTFLIIFIATAILTLASLPEWIKIPDKYRKVLFTTLIVEVVGCVIILFKSTVIGEHKIFPDKNWFAIEAHTGKILNPFI